MNVKCSTKVMSLSSKTCCLKASFRGDGPAMDQDGMQSTEVHQSSEHVKLKYVSTCLPRVR